MNVHTSEICVNVVHVLRLILLLVMPFMNESDIKLSNLLYNNRGMSNYLMILKLHIIRSD
jgi:hypothetical protein